MYFVDNQGQLDPSVNIALETYLLEKKNWMNLFYFFILMNLLLLLVETKTR